MKIGKKALLLLIVSIFTLCLFGCSKRESESYLHFLQEQGVTDNSQDQWQDSKSSRVQISPHGIFMSEVKNQHDKTLYQLENGEYRKIAEEAYGFFEFGGKVYFYNGDNNVYCYDIGTEHTTMVFSVSMDISWISLYDNNILCAGRSGIFNKVLELYTLDGKWLKTYFDKRGRFGQIVLIGRFVVFLENLKAEVYDLENEKSRYLIWEDGLSDSFMVSNQNNLYISIGRYTIEGDYNTSEVDSKWNGLWKISLSDMEKGNWELTKISDHSYSKFYCVENKLYDEEFLSIK